MDRFTNLPDKIVHRILFLLDVADLSQLMDTSQRCRQLCLTTPTLKVDNREHSRDLASLSQYYLRAQQFLALRHRARTTIVKNFSFTWTFIGMDDAALRQRVHKLYCKTLLHCEVESLCLNFISDDLKPLFLDPVLFSAGPRQLLINGNNCPLYFPEISAEAPNLHTLILQSVKLYSSSVIKSLICRLHSLKRLGFYGCSGIRSLIVWSKSIEELRIYEVDGVSILLLSVTCLCLKILKVKWFPAIVDVPNSSPDLPIFHLEAPCLEDLRWDGLPFGTFSYSKSFPLRRAEIALTRPSTVLQGMTPSGYQLKAVFEKVARANDLKLNVETLMLSYTMGVLSLPLVFATEAFSIENSFLLDSEVIALAFVLSKMPILKSLSIKTLLSDQMMEKRVEVYGPQMRGFTEKRWVCRGLKFPQLKRAEIEVFGEGNSLELVKFLLKIAKGLESLRIVCRGDLAPNLVEGVMGCKSTSTTVHFN